MVLLCAKAPSAKHDLAWTSFHNVKTFFALSAQTAGCSLCSNQALLSNTWKRQCPLASSAFLELPYAHKESLPNFGKINLYKRHTHTHTHKHTNTNTQTSTQTNTHTNKHKHASKQTNKQTNKHTHTCHCCLSLLYLFGYISSNIAGFPLFGWYFGSHRYGLTRSDNNNNNNNNRVTLTTIQTRVLYLILVSESAKKFFFYRRLAEVQLRAINIVHSCRQQPSLWTTHLHWLSDRHLFGVPRWNVLSVSPQDNTRLIYAFTPFTPTNAIEKTRNHTTTHQQSETATGFLNFFVSYIHRL